MASTGRSFRAVAAFLFLLILGGFIPKPANTLTGFRADRVDAQLELEKKFDQQLKAENLERWMKRLTSKPQHVGSSHGKANAEFLADQFRSWGFETEIEVFHVLFPTPIERSLVLMNGQSSYTAELDEPIVPGDQSSAVREEMLPPYNAYSADGDVTAELVYVNYGIPTDYEELDRMGIDVKGKIVIARYGRSWRGIKAKVAYEHGAVGCLIYSDPEDDGFVRGDVYPDGPFRNAHGAQRGSVADMPLYPGDPLTPGVGAKEDTPRLSREESPTLMKIPVLPISYHDAQPLLASLGGLVAPDDFRGGLPLTYHIGPGPSKVHLKLRFSWDIVPAYNVIARLAGSDFPDEWIMRGNHRDAWVFGAADPTSGTVAMMEEARAIGELVKSGWRPRRTIVYGSWDAEEPGLLGSTEWAEYHADELRKKLAVYLNSDSNGRGFLGVGGSHALEQFVQEVADAVIDPQTGVSVSDRSRARIRVRGDDKAGKRKNLRLSPLGSGSDYTPFLQHLGVSSLNIGYGGESSGGSYHSAYDSFEHYTQFGDPGFDYGIALAKTAGRMTLRLAEADVLPFVFAGLVDNVKQYADEVTELPTKMRTETDRLNGLVRDNAFELAADPTRKYVPPIAKSAVPHMDFSALLNAIDELEAASTLFDTAVAKTISALQSGNEMSSGAMKRQLVMINDAIRRSDETLTRDAGLPGRKWFKHHIYAPGFYTGYGVKTLPAIREAIEERDWDLASAGVDHTASAIRDLASLLTETAEQLK